MSMSCYMCEHMENAQSLWRRHSCGGYTAKVVIRARGTHRVFPNASLAHRQVLGQGRRQKSTCDPDPL